MRYLLSRASHPVLTRLARERTLCAFDFDGTLAPIVDHPDSARLRAQTRKLLSRLAALYPCMVVSGRARADVVGKLQGAGIARVVGNHGAETGAGSQTLRRQAGRWKAALEERVGSLPGVWIEDKSLSLAVHYRASQQKAEARRKILKAAEGLKDIRVFGGKQVVNLAGKGARDKGHAVAAERERLGCNLVLFVGDDENDEAAFAIGGDIVAVRIGRKRDSHARYYLREQTEIDRLLEALVVLRTSGGSGRDS